MIDVQTLAIGLDASARPAIQKRMRELAEQGDTRTKDGLAALLGQVADALLAHEASFTHAFCESTPKLPPKDAEGRFKDAALRARSRFPVEVIRNADGTTTTRAPPKLSPSTEPGVVIVTLVLARRSEIPDLPEHPDRTALRRALEDAGRTTAQDLVAMEVIWSPAEDADRVSAEDLAARHPEIAPLA